MSGDALPWSEAIRRFDDIRLLPFYNYYYTSETRAVASFLVQIALYAPPGILLALGTRSWGDGGGAAAAGATSGILALAAQVVRLMHPPQHADPTDVLIAVAAGWGGYRITRFLIRLASGENAAAEHVSSSGVYSRTLDGLATRWWVPALIAAGLAVFVVRFPVMRLELGLGLIAYCVLMFRYPKNWLVILLALLPTLDLAPWSGRYNFDEFDALVLASVAVGAVRLSDSNAIRWPPWLAMLFGLFLLSAIVSIARGFVPWPSPSFLALAGYQSPLNALRVGRGLIWSCALLWLLVRTAPDPTDGQSRFALGMTLGLLGVGLIVLWERIVFTGLFNFRNEYRVAGTFSAISTAGAQIESYLAAATPFAMLIALRSRGWARLVGLAALGLMLYAVASTASRSAYAGVALAAGLMTVGWLWSAESMRRKLLVGLVVPAFALLIWMLVGGSYVTQRMADAGHDLAERKSHWALVLDLMDTNLATHVFGMGIGQYSPTFLWKAPTERRPGTFAFVRDGADSMVRLGTGHAVYVDQFVHVDGGQRYILRGRLRGQPNAEGILKLALCDKWILYGLDCVDTAITASSSGAWELFSRPVVAQGLGRGPPLFRRPVKLSLYNVGPTTIDVADLKLEDARGRNILDNGDFARGGDRWYFSADDHFPWNIFNLFVEIFFEQGWLGLASFATLLGAVLLCLAKRAFHGNLGAAAFLSSLLGYLLPGLFDSVIDDPRMRLLLILLVCASVLLTKRDGGVAGPIRASH